MKILFSGLCQTNEAVSDVEEKLEDIQRIIRHLLHIPSPDIVIIKETMIPGDYVEISVSYNDEDGYQYHGISLKTELVEKLIDCAIARRFYAEYPNATRYGVPSYATDNGGLLYTATTFQVSFAFDVQAYDTECDGASDLKWDLAIPKSLKDELDQYSSKDGE